MKFVILGFVAACLVCSCKKEEKACYIFTVTTTNDILPPVPDYPKTEVFEEEECDLTADEAKEINSGYFIDLSTNAPNGKTYITKATSTFRKK